MSVRVLVVWFKALDSEEDMLQTAGLSNTENYTSEDKSWNVLVSTKIIHVHANTDKCNQSTSIKQAKLIVNAHKDNFGLNSFCNFGNFYI